MHEVEPTHRGSEALAKSREIYEALLAYSRDAVLGVNRKGAVIFWNKGAERVFGYPAEEILGRSVTALLTKKHRESHRLVLKAFLGGDCGKTRAIEAEAQSKDGSTFPVELSFSVEQQNGKSLALAVARNVAQHRQTQKALRESAERYCGLLSTCLETVLRADVADDAATGNKAVEKLSGYCLEELLQMTPAAVLTPERREYLSKRVDKALNADGPSGSMVHGLLSEEGRRALAVKYLDSLNVEEPRASCDSAGPDTMEIEVKSSFVKLAKIISHVIEFCDPYTASHQERVAELACLVARHMGLADDVIESLYFDGLLHDIGKISIPKSILTKPGDLAEEEWALIRAHTKQGYNILKEAKLPWPVADVALQHHERLDGSGYPNGIGRDELDLEVSILAVCDVVEAMSSHRPYRPARSTGEIVKELEDGRGTKYDAGVIDVILPKIESGEFRSMWSCADSSCTAR